MPAIEFLDEAKRLVKFNTVTTQSNAECAVYVGQLLQRVGCRVQYQEYRDGGQVFLNVIGLLGEGSAPPLLLTSHLDTVDPGNPKLWTKTGGDPWHAVVRGDSIYGLGTADDKLDFLCKIMALSHIAPKTLKRPVMVLGTFGEERGLLGAVRFCQGSLPRPSMAIVGEPSNLRLVPQHKGLLVGELSLLRRGVYRTEGPEPAYELETTGMAAHSSTPHLGRNAVTQMLEALAPLTPPSGGLKVLAIEGGTAPNIIPARCTALVVLSPAARRLLTARRGVRLSPTRLPAGWHPTLPWADLVAYVKGLEGALAPYRKAKGRGFVPPTMTSTLTRVTVHEGALTLTFDVRALPGQALEKIARRCEQLAWDLFGPPGDRWQFRRERQNPALHVAPSAPVVTLMRSAMRAAHVPTTLVAKAGCSEAGWYQMVGIPSVVFGPGQAQGNIHQPNERNSLRQLRRAIAVYRQVIDRACVKGA